MASENNAIASDDLLDIHQVHTRVGFAESTIRQWARIGMRGFPKPLKIGRNVRWHSSEIEAWIKQQLQAAGIQSE